MQLELDLRDVRRRIPWAGFSPRELTRSFGTFSFTAEGMGRLNGDAGPERGGESEASCMQLAFPLRGGTDG